MLSLLACLGVVHLLIGHLITTPGSKFCCNEAAFISYTSSCKKNLYLIRCALNGLAYNEKEADILGWALCLEKYKDVKW